MTLHGLCLVDQGTYQGTERYGFYERVSTQMECMGKEVPQTIVGCNARPKI